MIFSQYKRTVEQDLACGLTPHPEGAIHCSVRFVNLVVGEEPQEPAPPLDKEEKEVLTFPGHCSTCGANGDTRMVVTGIFCTIYLFGVLAQMLGGGGFA